MMKSYLLHFCQTFKPSRSSLGLCCLVLSMINLALFFSVEDLRAEIVQAPRLVTGEKLTFEIRWSFIPAGKAVLSILPQKTINGSSANHFMLSIKSYPMLDMFYKVRDRLESFTDPAVTHALVYKKKKEGKNPRDVVVRFDWRKKVAQYENFGRPEEPIAIKPGAMDPLSGFYFTRLQDLRPGMEITRPVTDGKKEVIGRIHVLGREEVTVASGTYDTYLLEPELQNVRGVFEKSKNARMFLWVTADERRLPVKLKSKVIVGSFVAELINVEYVQ